MSLVGDFRVDIGDDLGSIPSGIFPSGVEGLPIGANTTLITDLRVDIGDDAGTIPSGIFVSGVLRHDLLSTTHADTIPFTPTQAEVIRSAGGTWQALPSGQDGYRLTMVAGSVEWAEDITATGVIADFAAHTGNPSAHHARYTDAEASGVAVQVAETGIETTITIHEALPDIHHSRYTDAEASGVAVQVAETGIETALLIHESLPDVHHSRYTDAEASGVAVQVVTTGIANHAALPDVHHTRYTDAEAIAAVGGSGSFGIVLQESGVELLVDATTTSVQPIFSTLLTAPINRIEADSDLRILATAAINANGAVPVLFHIYLDGIFVRATTINVTGAIDNAAIVIPRVSPTGTISNTVELRWAKFNQPAVTVNCLPVSSSGFFHASLSVQEISN